MKIDSKNTLSHKNLKIMGPTDTQILQIWIKKFLAPVDDLKSFKSTGKFINTNLML